MSLVLFILFLVLVPSTSIPVAEKRHGADQASNEAAHPEPFPKTSLYQPDLHLPVASSISREKLDNSHRKPISSEEEWSLKMDSKLKEHFRPIFPGKLHHSSFHGSARSAGSNQDARRGKAISDWSLLKNGEPLHKTKDSENFQEVLSSAKNAKDSNIMGQKDAHVGNHTVDAIRKIVKDYYEDIVLKKLRKEVNKTVELAFKKYFELYSDKRNILDDSLPKTKGDSQAVTDKTRKISIERVQETFKVSRGTKPKDSLIISPYIFLLITDENGTMTNETLKEFLDASTSAFKLFLGNGKVNEREDATLAEFFQNERVVKLKPPLMIPIIRESNTSKNEYVKELLESTLGHTESLELIRAFLNVKPSVPDDANKELSKPRQNITGESVSKSGDVLGRTKPDWKSPSREDSNEESSSELTKGSTNFDPEDPQVRSENFWEVELKNSRNSYWQLIGEKPTNLTANLRNESSQSKDSELLAKNKNESHHSKVNQSQFNSFPWHERTNSPVSNANYPDRPKTLNSKTQPKLTKVSPVASAAFKIYRAGTSSRDNMEADNSRPKISTNTGSKLKVDTPNDTNGSFSRNTSDYTKTQHVPQGNHPIAYYRKFLGGTTRPINKGTRFEVHKEFSPKPRDNMEAENSRPKISTNTGSKLKVDTPNDTNGSFSRITSDNIKTQHVPQGNHPIAYYRKYLGGTTRPINKGTRFEIHKEFSPKPRDNMEAENSRPKISTNTGSKLRMDTPNGTNGSFSRNTSDNIKTQHVPQGNHQVAYYRKYLGGTTRPINKGTRFEVHKEFTPKPALDGEERESNFQFADLLTQQIYKEMNSLGIDVESTLEEDPRLAFLAKKIVQQVRLNGTRPFNSTKSTGAPTNEHAKPDGTDKATKLMETPPTLASEEGNVGGLVKNPDLSRTRPKIRQSHPFRKYFAQTPPQEGQQSTEDDIPETRGTVASNNKRFIKPRDVEGTGESWKNILAELLLHGMFRELVTKEPLGASRSDEISSLLKDTAAAAAFKNEHQTGASEFEGSQRVTKQPEIEQPGGSDKKNISKEIYPTGTISGHESYHPQFEKNYKIKGGVYRYEDPEEDLEDDPELVPGTNSNEEGGILEDI